MNDPDAPTGAALPTGPEAPTTAVIVAAGEETRVLLRGLLRLQHFQVVGESEGTTDGLQLLRQHRPSLVLIETNLAEGSAAALARMAREILPTALLVVIGTLDPEGGSVPPELSVTVLRKPFRIAEFSKAIGRDDGHGTARPG